MNFDQITLLFHFYQNSIFKILYWPTICDSNQNLEWIGSMEYGNDIKIIPKRRQVMTKSQKFESYEWISITIRALRKTFCQIEFFLTICFSTTKTPESAKKVFKIFKFWIKFQFQKKKSDSFCHVSGLRWHTKTSIFCSAWSPQVPTKRWNLSFLKITFD
jgi:hypothetical protein